MGNESMQPADVLTLRMASLLLSNVERAEPRTPAEIVTWFGAMQAQDLGSGEWSFGVRIPGCSRAEIDIATQNREIVRTWPMRGTVHFVPPVDAKWMLELTGVRALAGAAKRREYLGLTEDIVDGAVEVIEGALRGGKRMARSELVTLLVDKGLHTRTEHGYHLLWYASQVGVTCIGPQDGNEQTFVLLDEWVPEPRRLSRDEALAELALRYFRSHGPTTRQDFAGWTGLPASDAKLSIELASDALVSVDVEGTPHVLTASLRDKAEEVIASTASEVLLLPGFDEYMLGFKDRTLMVSKADMATVIPGGNGVFMSTIVVAGRVAGTWRRDVKRNLKSPRVDIGLQLFSALTKVERSDAERAAHDYARFHELDARVAWL
jgi:Winged helix DNA-binding domain